MASTSVLGVVAAGWLGLNLLRRDVRIANGAPLHTCDFLALKRSIADEVQGARIVFFGLSNVMMGVRSEQIGAALGRPALNYGLVANLSPGMALEALESTVSPGDLVVLSLPYWFFQAETTLAAQERVVRDLVFSCRTSGYFRLPLRYQIKFLLQQSPAQVLEALGRKGLRSVGLGALWEGPAVLSHLRRERDGGVFTRTGDWIGNARSDRTPELIANVRSRPNTLSSYAVEPEGESARYLARFVRTARARGIRVVALWPPAYVGEAGSPAPRDRAPIIDQIRALYGRLDVTILGEPEEFFYPLDAFFDSSNHLTQEASEVYSARVSELLRPLVEPPAAPR